MAKKIKNANEETKNSKYHNHNVKTTGNSWKNIDKEDLTQLALNEIGEYNHVHKDSIPNFEKMLKQNIIKMAEPMNDYYYLSWSFPF